MTAATTRDRPPRPLVIAHRGASAQAPENTIAAFELALARGADGIALEIHLSRDGQPVVIHDFTLERTTDGRGRVQDHTVRELKRLDAGGWYGRAYGGQRLQTLQEVFERFRDRTRFWIELRGAAAVYPGIEEKVVSMIEIYDVLQTTLLQSSDSKAIVEVKRINPEVPLGIITADDTVEAVIRSRIGVSAISPDVRLATAEVVRRIIESDFACYVWTVNEPAQMDRLVEWGATGIVTDAPDLLRGRLDP